MIEIEHSLTTSMAYIENFADRFTSACGEDIYIEDNALIFPPHLAKGKGKFYNLEQGMSVMLWDCQFFQPVTFKRKPTPTDDFVTIIFNLSVIPVLYNKHSGTVVDVGTNWENAVTYSSSTRGSELSVSSDGNLRMVGLIVSRDWILTNYGFEKMVWYDPLEPEGNDGSQQFTIDLDIQLLVISQEMLLFKTPEFMNTLYFQGCAKRLIALFADRLVKPVTDEEKLKFEEVVEVMMMKEKVERAVNEPLPLVEDLAGKCNMSRTKFSGLFKAIYHKTYSDYFMEVKMQKAAALLVKGKTVFETGHAVGYTNLGHFSRAFKDYFKTTPKAYQKGAKPDKSK